MKKLMKVLVGAVAAVVVLVAALVGVAAIAIDPEDIKTEVAVAVREQTGRELALAGPVSLSVFPWLGVDARDVTLGNAPGFADPVFLRADRIQVRVKLMPLLERRVEMDTVRISGADVRLARAADGRTNWDDLAGGGGGGGGQVGALALGGLEIEGARAQWDDQSAPGGPIEVRDLDITTGPLDLSAPIPVELAFDLVATEPAMSGRVSAAGALALDLARARHELRGMTVELELAGAALAGGGGRLEATSDLVYDEAARRLEANALRLTSPALTVGAVAASFEASGELALDLASQVVDLRALRASGQAQGETVPGGAIDLELAGDVRADLAAGTLAVNELELASPAIDAGGRAARVELAAASARAHPGQPIALTGLVVDGTLAAAGSAPAIDFNVAGDAEVDPSAGTAALTGARIEAGDLAATGDLAFAGLGTTPKLSGTLAIAETDPRAVAALAGTTLPATRDPRALSKLGGTVSFALEGETVAVERMRLAVDDSTIEGSAHATTGASGAEFDIRVDQLDLDRYLPPASAPATPAAAAGGAAALPVETLRALDLDGRLRIGTLRAAGLGVGALDARLKADEGLVQVAPLKARLYGGTYAGNVAVDARGETTTLAVEEKLTGVDVRALAAALGMDLGDLQLGSDSDVSLSARASGDPATGRYRLSRLALDARVPGSSFPGNQLDVGLGGAFDIDLEKQTAVSDAFELRYGDLEARGKIAATRIVDDPHLAGAVSVPAFNPRALLATLGIDVGATQDPQALGSGAMSATLTASRDSLALKDLELALDQSTLSGEIAVSNFEQPAIRFDLDVDGIDADRYLPPGSSAQGASPGAAAALLPVDTLRALDLDGQLRVGQLKIGNVQMSNARFTARAKDGDVRLHPLDAQLYGGTYQGNVAIDARGAQPVLTVDERLNGIQTRPLLTAVQGGGWLSGVADVHARLSATGQTADALKRTLNGTAALSLRDGAYHGMNAVRMICNGLGGRGIGQPREGDATPFTSLTATVQVTDGVLANEDLVVTSPELRVVGRGGASLVTERVSYAARVGLQDRCASEGLLQVAGVDIADLTRGGIPVYCRGTLSQPACVPDVDHIVQLATQQTIQRAVGGQIEKAIGGQGQQIFGDLLRGIIPPAR